MTAFPPTPRPAALILAALSLFLASGPGAGQDQDGGIQALVKAQQQGLPYFDGLMDSLDIRPGMTLLDIGAGTGQQSLRLAERMKGTGRVYATEIEPKLVDAIAAQARGRGLDDVEAVLVSPDGVDPFYGRHRYDIIFFIDVYDRIADLSGYLPKMKSFLRPNGRIVVFDLPGDRLRGSDQFSFSREDFADLGGLVRELRELPSYSPFARARTPELNIAMHGRLGGDGLVERAALYELNALMKSDIVFSDGSGAKAGFLFSNLADGLDFNENVSFTTEEKPMASWLLHRLRRAKVAETPFFNALPVRTFGLVQMLNKLLLIQRFRPYLVRPIPYYSNAVESRWLLDKKLSERVGAFGGAGMRLERIIDVPPFQKAMIFAVGASGQDVLAAKASQLVQ